MSAIEVAHLGRPPYVYRYFKIVEPVLWEQDPVKTPIVRLMYGVESRSLVRTA